MKERKFNIPIAKTFLKENEIEAILGPLRSGWLVQGPRVEEFESKWCQFSGAKNSIAVTSCTSGLLLSLVAIGFKPGDEAIVPAFTWISTANVVEQLGGKPVFCDIDLENFNIKVDAIESLITKKTRVILPVHLFGLSADMNPILDLATKYNLRVIEDAACGFGSRYDGSHVGSFGDTGVFSFHPRKAITTGEGGMITTESSKIASKLRCLRDHGAIISDRQRHEGSRPYLLAEHEEAGYNQRMTDIQAAIGSAQMDRASEILEERKCLAKRYDDAFNDLSWLNIPKVSKKFSHGYQSYPCILFKEEVLKDPKKINLKKLNKLRNSWMDKLFSIGISTRPSTHAVHMLTYYKKKYSIEPEDFPNAFAANDCSISFPLFNGMSLEEQDFVIDNVLAEKFDIAM